MLGFPFNICATAEVSNFKFCRLLGFAKAHHKNHNQRKSGRFIGLGKLPNIWTDLIRIKCVDQLIVDGRFTNLLFISSWNVL